MKTIVSYAKMLCITVVPEIEMPGHSRAALASYPELSCEIKPEKPVPNRWGNFKTNYCLGNSATIQFSKNILDEALEIFDSEIIHIGGDQVRPDNWLKCPKCQKVWKEEKIETPKECQCWFTKQIAAHLNQNGRNIIGWNEVLDESLPKNIIIMTKGLVEKGYEASNLGYRFVWATFNCFYFDYCQFHQNDGHI